MLSRRKLLQVAGTGGAGLLVAGCGDDDEDDAPRSPDPDANQGEVAVLNALLALEHVSVAFYAAAGRRLRGETLEALRLLHRHEREHADALVAAIRRLGGTPGGRLGEADPLRGLRTREDLLRFAVDLETTGVAAYTDALPKLSSRELRGTASAILTCEAEHLALLRGLLGDEQVTEAFVTGESA